MITLSIFLPFGEHLDLNFIVLLISFYYMLVSYSKSMIGFIWADYCFIGLDVPVPCSPWWRCSLALSELGMLSWPEVGRSSYENKLKGLSRVEVSSSRRENETDLNDWSCRVFFDLRSQELEYFILIYKTTSIEISTKNVRFRKY